MWLRRVAYPESRSQVRSWDSLEAPFVHGLHVHSQGTPSRTLHKSPDVKNQADQWSSPVIQCDCERWQTSSALLKANAFLPRRHFVTHSTMVSDHKLKGNNFTNGPDSINLVNPRLSSVCLLCLSLWDLHASV